MNSVRPDSESSRLITPMSHYASESSGSGPVSSGSPPRSPSPIDGKTYEVIDQGSKNVNKSDQAKKVIAIAALVGGVALGIVAGAAVAALLVVGWPVTLSVTLLTAFAIGVGVGAGGFVVGSTAVAATMATIAYAKGYFDHEAFEKAKDVEKVEDVEQLVSSPAFEASEIQKIETAYTADSQRLMIGRLSINNEQVEDVSLEAIYQNFRDNNVSEEHQLRILNKLHQGGIANLRQQAIDEGSVLSHQFGPISQDFLIFKKLKSGKIRESERQSTFKTEDGTLFSIDTKKKTLKITHFVIRQQTTPPAYADNADGSRVFDTPRTWLRNPEEHPDLLLEYTYHYDTNDSTCRRVSSEEVKDGTVRVPPIHLDPDGSGFKVRQLNESQEIFE